MKLVLGSVDLLFRDKGLHPLQLWSGEAGDLLVVFFLAPLSFLPGFLFLMETVTREWAAESPWSRGGGRLWLVLSHRRSGGGGIRAVPPPPWLAHCPTQAFFLLAQPSPGNR